MIILIRELIYMPSVHPSGSEWLPNEHPRWGERERERGREREEIFLRKTMAH